MNNYQSPNPEDLVSFQKGFPSTTEYKGNQLAASFLLLEVLREQTIILKRINSKLWKLNDMLAKEYSSGEEETKDGEVLRED